MLEGHAVFFEGCVDYVVIEGEASLHGSPTKPRDTPATPPKDDGGLKVMTPCKLAVLLHQLTQACSLLLYTDDSVLCSIALSPELMPQTVKVRREPSRGDAYAARLSDSVVTIDVYFPTKLMSRLFASACCAAAFAGGGFCDPIALPLPSESKEESQQALPPIRDLNLSVTLYGHLSKKDHEVTCVSGEAANLEVIAEYVGEGDHNARPSAILQMLEHARVGTSCALAVDPVLCRREYPWVGPIAAAARQGSAAGLALVIDVMDITASEKSSSILRRLQRQGGTKSSIIPGAMPIPKRGSTSNNNSFAAAEVQPRSMERSAPAEEETPPKAATKAKPTAAASKSPAATNLEPEAAPVEENTNHEMKKRQPKAPPPPSHAIESPSDSPVTNNPPKLPTEVAPKKAKQQRSEQQVESPVAAEGPTGGDTDDPVAAPAAPLDAADLQRLERKLEKRKLKYIRIDEELTDREKKLQEKEKTLEMVSRELADRATSVNLDQIAIRGEKEAVVALQQQLMKQQEDLQKREIKLQRMSKRNAQLQQGPDEDSVGSRESVKEPLLTSVPVKGSRRPYAVSMSEAAVDLNSDFYDRKVLPRGVFKNYPVTAWFLTILTSLTALTILGLALVASAILVGLEDADERWPAMALFVAALAQVLLLAFQRFSYFQYLHATVLTMDAPRLDSLYCRKPTMLLLTFGTLVLTVAPVAIYLTSSKSKLGLCIGLGVTALATGVQLQLLFLSSSIAYETTCLLMESHEYECATGLSIQTVKAVMARYQKLKEIIAEMAFEWEAQCTMLVFTFAAAAGYALWEAILREPHTHSQLQISCSVFAIASFFLWFVAMSVSGWREATGHLIGVVMRAAGLYAAQAQATDEMVAAHLHAVDRLSSYLQACQSSAMSYIHWRYVLLFSSPPLRGTDRTELHHEHSSGLAYSALLALLSQLLSSDAARRFLVALWVGALIYCGIVAHWTQSY